MKMNQLAVAVAAATLSTVAFGHGYVSSPEGRSFACKTGLNNGCGAVQYEPQSVEGPDGNPRFPIGGPSDGTIAAAGSPAWSELNSQSPSRWYKHDFASGPQTIEWRFTANHTTRDWRYFITKPDWNPAELLNRDQFDLTPFCEVDGGMVRPPMTVSHDCVVPEREGYHVILAVWDVGDTSASFYNMIDVNFDGTNPDPVDPVDPVDPIAEVGLISGAIALDAGDVISTVVFDENGELPSLSVSYEATGPVSGSVASFELAKLINETGAYYAGQRNGDVFSPVTGVNTVYAEAPITNVETRVDFAPDPELPFVATVTGTPDEVEFNAMGMLDVPFTVSVNGNSTVTATLYDAANNVVIGDDWSVGGTADLKLHVHMPKEETYTVIVVINESDGNGMVQVNDTVVLVDNRVEPEPPVTCGADPMAGMNPEYSNSTTYTGGEQVSYNGLVYVAKWWTVGAAPDSTDAFELVSDVSLPYSATTAYSGGDQVTFEGGLYQAKWWTRGNDPLNGPWTRVGDAPSC